MPIIHHRAPDFIPVLDTAKKGLQWLCQTKNDVLTLCSTGTGGMVGSVNNFFSPADKALVINAGNFGERWTKICTAYKLDVKEIKLDWGYAVNPADVEKALKEDPLIKGVFVQASETSTGVYHDIEGIASVVTKHEGTLLVVDAISALVAHARWMNGESTCDRRITKRTHAPAGARLCRHQRQGLEVRRQGPVPEVHDLVINYDARLYKCPGLIGLEGYDVGTVREGVCDYSASHKLDIWKTQECRECVYLPLCYGGCRNETLLRNGSIDAVDCRR